MILQVHPDNPQERYIRQVKECLQSDGVIIYPTDTVYGLGCNLNSKKAIEKICRIKGIKPEHAQFSILCQDLKEIGKYGIHISTPTFRMMKKVLPGPFTFILEASRDIPKFAQSRRKTIGVRCVSNRITDAILNQLGNPLVNTSLRKPDELWEDYYTDPEMIHEVYGKMVDIVIDGGRGSILPSTVVDCSQGEEWSLIREGAGDVGLLD